jgi:hypothetical protein
MVVAFTPCATFVTVTDAAGITPPVASVTVPEIDPVTAAKRVI